MARDAAEKDGSPGAVAAGADHEQVKRRRLFHQSVGGVAVQEHRVHVKTLNLGGGLLQTTRKRTARGLVDRN
jgi:hypothetical protein